MSPDKDITFNAQITEEAAAWFVEFRSGDIDAGARQRFDAWIRASPEHLRAYLEVAAIWNEGHSLDSGRAHDTEALIMRARAAPETLSLRGDIVPAVSAVKARVHSIPARRWASAAATGLLVLAGVCFAWLELSAAPAYATQVGEQRSLRLPDGSTVELNSRSRIRVLFTEQQRGIELLEGQALFKVQKDAVRPFVVRSDAAYVRAVGTQFDVNRKEHSTVVTVLEGRVTTSIGPSGATPDEAVVSAGEQVTVADTSVPRVVAANVSSVVAWRQQQIVLQAALLTDIPDEFNRYSERRIVVEEAASQPLRISGVFSTNPDFLISYLKDRPGVQVEVTDTQIRITHRD